jgi:CDP-diacylglycerol--glycerol-3-phosphate 3-phosphatidyltransferase
MTTANKITIFRVVLVPVLVLFMYLDFPGHIYWALAMFILASVSDFADGYIARHYNQVTDFGKFLDPLADKVLVLAALAVFVELDEIKVGAVPLIIISAREFMVSGLRLLAANSGVVVAAGIWGKLKTAFTMVTQVIILLVLCLKDFGVSLIFNGAVRVTIFALVWISVALTIISGAVYLKGYWKYIDMK